jgi:hypothetical protein
VQSPTQAPRSIIETAVVPERRLSLPMAGPYMHAAVPSPATQIYAERAARWLPRLSRLLMILLGLGTTLAIVAAARGIVAHGDWMYSDGVQLYHVLRIRDGFAPYPDFSESPFLALVYWPVYLGTAGLIARVAGLGTEAALYVTRMLAVLGTLVAAASIAGLAASCGARRLAALVASGFFLTAYVVHPWAYAARADLPGLAFVLVGFLLLMRSRSVSAAAAAGLLMALGFGCKQTFVIGVAVGTLTLLWRREWLRLVTLVGFWVATVVLIAVVMEVSSGGRFIENTVSSNLLPFRLQTMLDHVRIYVPLTLPLLLLAAAGSLGLPGRLREIRPVQLYALLATLVGLVTLARAGSYYNHLIETTALLSVLAGVGFERCLALRDRTVASTAPPPLRAVVPVAVMLVIAVCGSGIPTLALGFKAANPPDRSHLIEVLRAQPGQVLTEKDALAVMLAGKEPVGGDPLGAGLLARQDRWNPEPLNDMVRTQAFSIIALNQPLEQSAAFDEFAWWPPETAELMQQTYVFDRRLEGHYLYVPRTNALQEARP